MDKTKFYEILRNGKLLGPTLEKSEFEGVNAILSEGISRKWPVSWTAYALATAYHETAHTMQPIKEMGGEKYLTRMYDVQGNRPQMAKDHGNTNPGDGVKFCGRGFVQLTWKTNYEKASKVTGVDLVKSPDLAMDLGNAAKILASGMENGWFTGKSFRSYLNDAASSEQFVSARRIINGTDKADLIADYATRFQKALQTSNY